MGWVGVAEVAVVAVVLLVALPLIGLYARRRWLSSSGAVFDCALRLRDRSRGTGWATGVARYEGDELQWFRIFSLSTRPKVVLTRDATSSVGHRSPSHAESVVMFSHDQIMQLENRSRGSSRVWELAMNPASATGLMSWLEAAPPGGDSYSGLATSLAARIDKDSPA